MAIDPFAPPPDWDAKRRAMRGPSLYERTVAENAKEREQHSLALTKDRQREPIGGRDRRGQYAWERKIVVEKAVPFTEKDIRPAPRVSEEPKKFDQIGRAHV